MSHTHTVFLSICYAQNYFDLFLPVQNCMCNVQICKLAITFNMGSKDNKRSQYRKHIVGIHNINWKQIYKNIINIYS